MRITTKGRYALRAMANLALADPAKPKAIKQIAEEESISAEFLEQIFFRLRRAGAINSTRGPGGGFRLRKHPDEITLRMIFQAVDEGLDLTPCTTVDNEPGCERSDDCIVHDVWMNASRAMYAYFESVTLASVIAPYVATSGTATPGDGVSGSGAGGVDAAPSVKRGRPETDGVVDG
jgi:Rrf2 family transcriptional regulator, iron-sulfur cluster assembly transcription factor